MTFKLDVRGDVNRMLRQNAGMHEKILRAAARAVNATAADVRKAAIGAFATVVGCGLLTIQAAL